jgi:plasmid maintenance system antidote protein VapI
MNNNVPDPKSLADGFALRVKFRELALDASKTIEEITTACKIGPQTAIKLAKEMGLTEQAKGWRRSISLKETGRKKRQLYILLVEWGLQHKAAAEKIGVSEQTVCAWVKEMGGTEQIKKDFDKKNKVLDLTNERYLMFLKMELPTLYAESEKAHKLFIDYTIKKANDGKK